jgi:hypothetical protein
MCVTSGVLACLDGFMNIALEQTEEYVDGQLKARYGDCFIRGNNGKDTYETKELCVFASSYDLTNALSLCDTVMYISAAKSRK